jgi:CheY-like chemotaxis protein
MLPEAAVSTFEAQAPAVSPKRLRILVADSAEADRQSLKALLRRINEGVEVLEASNGPTAERMLRERNVDIAFIDRRARGAELVEHDRAPEPLRPRIGQARSALVGDRDPHQRL